MGKLAGLPIYGWDKIENLILAALVTGDSALFTGKHGIAKTYCAEELARALGVKYRKVDASKAEFEDYLGFPNPKALSEGRFEYIETPLSITDKEFVFIDEINRCRPSTQNKLLELVYERKFFGQDTNVTWLWAAMNTGDEYLATEKLDPAFLGRFAFIIPVPETADMHEDDICSICESLTEHDAPALRKSGGIIGLDWDDFNSCYAAGIPCIRSWFNMGKNEKAGAGDQDFKDRIKQASANYRKVYRDLNDTIAFSIANLSMLLAKENNLKLDGRRISMMRRSLLAYIAVVQQAGSRENILTECMEVIPYLIPEIALDDNPGRRAQLISALHLSFKQVFMSGEFVDSYLEKDIVKRMKALCSQDLPNFGRKKILDDVLSDEEWKPLICVALAPFVFIEDSLFSTAEAETIMTGLSRLVELNNSRVAIRSLDDLKRFSPEYLAAGMNRIRSLCKLYARFKAGSTTGAPELEENYMDFMKRCVTTLRPVYREELKKRGINAQK